MSGELLVIKVTLLVYFIVNGNNSFALWLASGLLINSLIGMALDRKGL